MKNIKGIIIIIAAIALAGVGVFLYKTSVARYSIIAFAAAVVLLIVGISSLLNNSSPSRIYENKVRNILNTYDSILVKSTTTPNLDDRNIINVLSIEDLIDAQMEIRKPICYLKQTESCSFVLLDDKEAYVYIEKVNEDTVSPIEIAIKESRLKNKNKDEMDSEMLRDIEKTTVIKLSNQKSYKVSPIRKKKKEEKENAPEEPTPVQETNQELDKNEEVKQEVKQEEKVEEHKPEEPTIEAPKEESVPKEVTNEEVKNPAEIVDNNTSKETKHLIEEDEII